MISLTELIKLVKDTPNNMELGKYIRRYSYQFDTTNENQLTFLDD